MSDDAPDSLSQPARPSANWRAYSAQTLAPSSQRPYNSNVPESSELPKKTIRGTLTQSACQRCRGRKAKCDGVREVCGRCAKDGAVCVYDVPREGITRLQNLQEQLDAHKREHAKLSAIFRALQQASDFEATSLLARIRLGSMVDELLPFVGWVQEGAAEETGTPVPSVEYVLHCLLASRWHLLTVDDRSENILRSTDWPTTR